MHRPQTADADSEISLCVLEVTRLDRKRMEIEEERFVESENNAVDATRREKETCSDGD